MVLTAEGGAPRWGADPSGQRRGGRSTARSLGQTQKFSGKFESTHFNSRVRKRAVFLTFDQLVLQRSFFQLFATLNSRQERSYTARYSPSVRSMKSRNYE